MEAHNPIRPDRSLLLGRQTLWDVVFHENNSTFNFDIFDEKHFFFVPDVLWQMVNWVPFPY